ncbi:MAG TPA: hypothetical protein VMF30_09470, partial [Pirellulales bacterium]|nr:hypothetical protein [Pirellulales bacterium]
MKKQPLSTSRRSAIQATDSARKGWTANTAATQAQSIIALAVLLRSGLPSAALAPLACALWASLAGFALAVLS